MQTIINCGLREIPVWTAQNHSILYILILGRTLNFQNTSFTEIRFPSSLPHKSQKENKYIFLFSFGLTFFINIFLFPSLFPLPISRMGIVWMGIV